MATLVGIIGGALYAFMLYRLLELHWLPQEFVSVAGIFGTPVAVGAICVGLSSPTQQANLSYRITAPWVSIFIAAVILLAARFETMICIVMLTPPLMLLTSIGGLMAGYLATVLRGRRGRRGVLGCFAVLPILLGHAEQRIAPVTEYHTVTDSIMIDAAPAVVWRNLIDVPDIRRDELRWSFSHAIGLPRPRAAILHGQGVGAVRDLYWDDGIHFRERVTTWQPAQRLAYDVDVSPAVIALRKLDTHVVIGDRYFDVLRGEYRLRAISHAQTELVLTTTYRISTNVNGYGNLWARNTLDDFQVVVLDLLKKRAEVADYQPAAVSPH